MNRLGTIQTYEEYDHSEEMANIITHGIGVILGLIGLVLFLVKGVSSGDWIYTVAVGIYSTTFIWTFSTSTLYHSAFKARVKVKNLFHLLDHTAIYLFIAGTYTPVALFALPDQWKLPILFSIWILAILGIIFKIYFIGKLKRLSTLFYLLMGWMIIIAAKPLLETAQPALILWIIAGGLCYSAGVFFFIKENIPFSHAIWHVFVLLGSICHFVAIYYFLDLQL